MSPFALSPFALTPPNVQRVGVKAAGRGRQKVLGTSTHLVPNRAVSLRVVRCQGVFRRAITNLRKKNPAYAPLSAHTRGFEFSFDSGLAAQGND